jgi:hypothetical protein
MLRSVVGRIDKETRAGDEVLAFKASRVTLNESYDNSCQEKCILHTR